MPRLATITPGAQIWRALASSATRGAMRILDGQSTSRMTRYADVLADSPPAAQLAAAVVSVFADLKIAPLLPGAFVVPPVGSLVPDHSAPRPIHAVIEGRYGRLRPLDPARDTDRLYALSHGAESESQWAYLFTGPYPDKSAFDAHVATIAAGANDPVYWAVADQNDEAVGWLSLMRIDTRHRVIEIGSILYTPAMQRTPLATEAQYLMARHVFETLGYRRYEWKCNDLNAPSKRAAVRFGFSYEGLFRQHMIVKGRNRDTAWFAMIDRDWPARKAVFETWLAPENFDEGGVQRTKLEPV